MNTIYIIVKGGMVEEVRASNDDTHIIIIDQDALDDGHRKRNKELLEGTKDFCKVFEG